MTAIEMKEGAIAFLDVLGWKGVWQRKGNPLKDLQSLVNTNKARLQGIGLEPANDTKEYFKEIEADLTAISDTIVIRATGECQKTLELVTLFCSMVTSDSISLGLPTRGAIGYGSYYAEDKFFVGPAVDEVASWHEQGEMIGAFLTPSAEMKLRLTELRFPGSFVESNVVFKGIGSRKVRCCDWPRALKHTSGNWEKGKADLVEALYKLGPIVPDISKKVDYALAFYEDCKNRSSEAPAS